MAGLLSNLRNTMIVSFILALVFVAGYYMHDGGAHQIFWQAMFRWLHVVIGIMWIGLHWYCNFVQTRKMPEIPAELKPAVSKFIAPEAMFWVRWAALFTVLMGLILAYSRGYLIQALALGFAETPASPAHAFIGLGMWLGIIMMINVWGAIWPALKIALEIVKADADAKAAAGRKGIIFT